MSSMTEILLSITPFKTMNCSINEERQYKIYSNKEFLFFFRMKLITKYNNQGLYPDHSCESNFILEFSFWALKRTAALAKFKKFASKTDSPNGLCQDKILSEYLKSASLEELVRSLKKRPLLHALSAKRH